MEDRKWKNVSKPLKPLKLKGEKKKSKRKQKSSVADEDDPDTVQKLQEVPGSGRIVSCGVTIHGFESKFKEELDIGDRLVIFHPKSLVDESSIVVAVLSQRSLTLNAPFSVDVTSTTAFRIKKESILLQQKASKTLDSVSKDNEITTDNVQSEMLRLLEKKLKKARPVLKYREKTGMWGYRTVLKRVPSNTTAEELLDMRAKHQGRDKYC